MVGTVRVARMSQMEGQSQTRRLGRVERRCTLTSRASQVGWWSLELSGSVRLVLFYFHYLLLIARLSHFIEGGVGVLLFLLNYFFIFQFIFIHFGKGREVLHTHLPCSPGYICNICQIGCFWSCRGQSVRPTQSREVLRTHLAKIRGVVVVVCTFGVGRMSHIGGQSQTGRLGRVGRCCTLTSHAPQSQSVWWSVARLQ